MGEVLLVFTQLERLIPLDILLISMIVQMLEVVEELMVAVVGGSAEIVGWPQKIVLCTAGVGADIFTRY